jgi:tetratricopeptide (TPR) repeat protein
MLDLKPIDPTGPRALSWLNPFKPEPGLREGMLEEILHKPFDHQDLIRRHGWRRALVFYEEQLLPALRLRLPGREAWRAWYEVGCRAVALRAAMEPDARMTRLAQELGDDLVRARFEADPAGDAAVRRQVRSFLASQLAGAAGRSHHDERTALEVYATLERLGSLNRAQRADYARLLWRGERRDPAALPVYLRHLCDHGWNAGPEGLKGFVLKQMAVEAQTPQEEIPRRLLLNQSALCSPRAPAETARHAGLAYLRLDKPEKAVPYLQQAQPRNGHDPDHGLAAFLLGQALFRTEDFGAAAEAFEKAAQQSYSRASIAAWLGLAYARSAQWEKALAAFRQAELELGDIREGEFFVDWGRAAFLMGDAADAEARFQRALDVEPESAPALHGRAICLEHLGRRSEAIDLLRPLTSGARIFAPAAHLLGRLLEAEGRRAEALASYRQAAEAAPSDPVYALSLGLALDDGSDPEALLYLERAAEAGQGGPEVVRRIVLRCFQHGDRAAARAWLDRLQADGLLPDSLSRLRARGLASEATEAFNSGLYEDAAQLWAAVQETYPDNPRVAASLSQALLCDATVRLKAGDVDGLWDQIGRAHQLAESFESRLLEGISHLIRSDLSGARQRLAALAAECPQQPAVAVFLALAACFDAEELTAGDLFPAPVLAFLKVYLAARRGDFEAAAEAVDAWVEDPESVRSLGLPRHLVNLLVAHCKLRGIRRKRQRIIRSLEDLNARYGDGTWNLALTVTRHHLAAAPGLARAAETDLAALEACDAAYWKLLQEASAEEREPVLRSHAELLQLIACHHLQRGDLAAALEALDNLTALTPDAARATGKLRKALITRMKRPSHAKAFSFLQRDPDAARTSWKALLKENPNDLTALHHLACLAWSRAWDAATEKRYEASLPFWREGLEHYRQLYARDDYWEELRQKGRALGQTAAHPFNEEAFATWRAAALFELAHTLIDLIFHVLAGFTFGRRANEVDPRILVARSLIEVVRSSKLESPLQDRLSESLADHYLDPDPTRLSSFDASTHRAEIVIDVDPASLKARSFLLRASIHQVDTQRKEGDRNYARMAKQLNALRIHAEWLDGHRKELPEDRGRRALVDLTSYYEQLAAVKHDEGGKETDHYNSLGRGQYQQAKAAAQRIRDCYQESDTALRKALSLDPLNPRAQETLEHHREQYKKIEGILG